MTRTLSLVRPSFWTEPHDPEVWFRALEALAAASRPQTGSPRTVAERSLAELIAWRGAVGLFGISSDEVRRTYLHGVGLVVQAEDAWIVTDEARTLLETWREAKEEGLSLLAGYIVRESPWLRLLLMRVLAGDWSIAGWPEVRASRAGLKVGSSLVLHRAAVPAQWLAGLEERAAGRWLARTGCLGLEIASALVARPSGRDALSLAPLAAPLHLLEAVGWWSPQGALQLPAPVLEDLIGEPSPADRLTLLSSRRADIRGFVPVEPTLRELLTSFDQEPTDFASWMDGLLGACLSTGAIEILAAEPGQARHGRGLDGDPQRKLVRWVIHRDFDTHFQRARASLGARDAFSQGPNGELTP